MCRFAARDLEGAFCISTLLTGDARELLPPQGAVLAAVLGGQQSHGLLEGTGELALVFIPHGSCHAGDGQVALPEQTGGFPHPQLPHRSTPRWELLYQPMHRRSGL